MRLKKPEAIHIQGVCVLCNRNKQTVWPAGKYRPVCGGCDNERRGLSRNHWSRKKERPYLIHRKGVCELCGFVPVRICQLDVDHIDGNHNNNEIDNLKTLCANCHRLKTYLNRDWEIEKGTI